jgi:hypothetical protein
MQKDVVADVVIILRYFSEKGWTLSTRFIGLRAGTSGGPM